jgi:capsular polysaccharide transport system ATP-binding protein
MIQLNNVYKFYNIQNHRRVVLDHVSTVFDTTYSYGLLGVNGAGKSTTLRLIAGTELPNSGRIRRTARVSFPLGITSGFHPLMTGRDNVHFVARVYGADVRKTGRFVEDFAELGDYYDLPINTYSSGMGARLAFGISMAIDFDVYLIDEGIAVGDAGFQARCEAIFAERRKTTSVIIVSHGMDAIARYCDRAGVLVDGRLTMYGDVSEAITMYSRLNR